MARPTSKIELIELSNKKFDDLFVLIHSISEKDQIQTFSFEDRDRNIRDVLVHLYEWHCLLLNWIIANTANRIVSFLPEPYNWRSYSEMNLKFKEKHKNTSLSKAKDLLKESHSEVMSLITNFSDDELFIKKYLGWTGSTHLASYCISSTSSHYDWAIKKIKRHKKNLIP